MLKEIGANTINSEMSCRGLRWSRRLAFGCSIGCLLPPNTLRCAVHAVLLRCATRVAILPCRNHSPGALADSVQAVEKGLMSVTHAIPLLYATGLGHRVNGAVHTLATDGMSMVFSVTLDKTDPECSRGAGPALGSCSMAIHTGTCDQVRRAPALL